MTKKKTHNSNQLLPRKENNRKNKANSESKKSERLIVLFNKPFQVLSQFTDDAKKPRKTLADYIPVKDVYAAGRLDYDSEGLLLLTNDGKLQAKISHPKFKQPKTYFVQVEGEISTRAMVKLRYGVELKDGFTQPAEVKKITQPLWLWPRNPPVRYRKSIPTSWIKLTITEGRNRQIRRMTAAVGYPTLRLIRYSIGAWRLDRINQGQFLKIKL